MMNIIEAISHPIRKGIIECFHDMVELSFSELLECVPISDNHGKFGYHLRRLRSFGLVDYVPSVKKYRLTKEGQLTDEWIWDAYFLIARQLNLTHEPTRYVRRLSLGDHAVLFYDTMNVKRRITFPYLLTGLLRGEAVAYLVSEDKVDSESRELRRYGISDDYFLKGALTIMSADEWYLNKGKAKAEAIINNGLTLLNEKLNAGFTGLRVASEMECFFNYSMSQELLRYEATLGRKLDPMVCRLCLYDTHRLDEEQLIHLRKNHGHIIFQGLAVKTS